MDTKTKKKIIDNHNNCAETTNVGMNQEVDYMEQIQKPRSGGILTFLKGHLFPVKGLTSQFELEAINKSKDITLRIILLAHKFIKPRLKDPKEYNVFVREVYRAFNVMIERENKVATHIQERWMKIRDILCYCLDGDKAYGFRAQDFASIIDIEKCKPDENDKYWMKIRRDKGKYNYGGKDRDWKNTIKT